MISPGQYSQLNFTFHGRNILRLTLRERENQKIMELFHTRPRSTSHPGVTAHSPRLFFMPAFLSIIYVAPMEYHLLRNGRNEGVFSLEELRRRRATGELSGTEQVWRQGMVAWAALDSVLALGQVEGTSATPPPLPPPARKPGSNPIVIGAIVTAVVVFVALLGYVVTRLGPILRRGIAQASDSEARSMASKPLSWNTNTLTEADIKIRGKEFRVRQYVEAYRKDGRHDQPWDADAQKLIESWVDSSYGGNAALPRKLGAQLAANPACDDPLVLTAAAANSIEVHEKMSRLERALTAYPKSSYKAYPQLFTTVSLATEFGDKAGRTRTLDNSAVQLFKETLSDGSFQPQDEPEVAEILIAGWGQKFFKRTGAAICPIARDAKGFDWLALVLEGEHQVNEAWKARTGGYANTVSEQGWKGFFDHLSQAHTAFAKAWKLRPERALAPTRMITVAMGETGAREMRTWFERAIAAQIDEPGAWSSMRWGLRPRWNGSHEAMLALGTNAIDTKRFDTDVPRKFFDVVADIESELELAPGEHIYAREDIWPQFQRLYEGYIAAPSQLDSRDGWRSSYATVAYFAGKYDVARQQLQALDWKPSQRNLTGWGVDLSLMPLKVAALTGGSAPKVARAESSYERHQVGEATRLYEEVASASDADERTRMFCRNRVAALGQETLLARGEWIDLMPKDEQDVNWVTALGKVRRFENGAVEIESDAEGHLLFSRVRVGTEFEVKGEFELVNSSTKDFQAGLVMGVPEPSSSGWYGFRMKRNIVEGEVVSFASGWSRQEVHRAVTLDGHRNSFQFKFHQGSADAWLNGAQVLQQAAPSKKMRINRDSLLGIGAFNDMNDTVIKYQNVKVRRLGLAEKEDR